MAKQLNVNVAVTADTAAAKAQLQELQNTLQQLTANGANLKVGLNTEELRKAVTDVDKLQLALKNATNSTGTLDFAKLSTSIKASGSTLQQYGNQLLQLGPKGQQAFSQLTAAISKSEIPMNRMKGLLGEFGTVLGNTIKWQAASSAIHGMMGSIQHAFSFAEQLNKSLNNIQIVTQQSDVQMAKFAESANKAAQRLNTTTTAYTDASLIYYQQGLSDKEVAARTETTIKMANASGQSAEKVSDQMTAIWNNFAEGSTNLEHYADVITALGAATASSSAEIATGLSKFASVADTVGLSYENATAALATITATTRQSADSVGTGLRTLFARLQSLNLGETLDDGTTLTKYTKALDTIGVQVLDAAGNMRSMDQILEDMGEKWQNLTDAQKTATAQTVGGVRQYTTLMALMENFDFYKENQQVAANADGTVQAQADIYAKSWEAAQKRVKAASEALYSDLIDDKFFIALNNGFAGFLSLLDQLIDGFGGLKTLLPGIAALLTNLFSDKITNGLVNLGQTFAMLKPGAAQGFRTERDQFMEKAALSMAGLRDQTTATAAQKVQLGFAEKEIGFQQAYLANQGAMTNMDKQYAQMQMDRYSNLRQEYGAAQKAVFNSQAQRRNTRGAMINGLQYEDKANFLDIMNDQKESARFGAMEKARDAAGLKKASDAWFDQDNNFSRDKWLKDLNDSGAIDDFTSKIDKLESKKNIIKELFENGTDGLTELMKEWDEKVGDGGFKDLVEGLTNDETGELDQAEVDKYLTGLSEDQGKAVQSFAQQWGLNEQAVQKYSQAIIEAQGNEEKLKQIAREIEQTEKNATEAVNKRNKQMQTAQDITNLASGLLSVTTAATTMSSTIDNVFTMAKEGSLSFGNAITGVVVPSLMSMMTIMTGIDKLSQVSFLSGLPIQGIVIGILAAVAAFKILDEMIESPAEKLERLKTEAEEAQNSADEAKQAYDDFLSMQSSRNAVLEEIQNLTKGTQEYINKVKEANDITQEMINGQGLQYGKDFWYDENGILQIAEEAQEKIAQGLNDRSQSAAHQAAYADLQFENEAREQANEEREWDLQFQREAGRSQIDSWFNARLGAYKQIQNDLGITDAYDNKKARNTAYDQITDNNLTGQLSALDVAQIAASAEAMGMAGQTITETLTNLFTAIQSSENADIAGLNYGFAGNQLYSILQSTSAGDLASTLSRGANDTFAQFGAKGISGNLEQVINTLFEQTGGRPEDLINSIAQSNNESLQSLNQILPSFESMLVSVMGENRLDQGEDYKGNRISESTAMEDMLMNFSQLYPQLQAIGERFQNLSEEDIRETLERDEGQKYKTSSYWDQDNQRWDYDKIRDAMSADAIWDAVGQRLNNTLSQYQNTGGYDWNDSTLSWLTQDILDQIKTGIAENGEEINPIYQKAAEETFTNAQKDLRTSLESSLKDVTGEFTPEKIVDQFMSSDAFKQYTLGDYGRVANLAKNLSGFGANTVKAFLDNVDPNNIENFSNLFSGESLIENLTNAFAEVKRTGNEAVKDIADHMLEDIGGPQGALSKVFEDADFQKEFKKVQKGFKKTGKIGMDEMEDLMDASEDLADLFNFDVLDSIGAVADAFELYSMDAIDSIDSISDALWEALEAANGFEDGLKNAFDFMAEFDPGVSVAEIDDFINKWSKDYFGELGKGTVGSDRLYNTGKMLWGGGEAGQNYINSMMDFFLGQEGKGYDPEVAQKMYTEQFGKFDEVWQKVQSQGHMGAYWNFLLNGENQGIISDVLGVRDASGVGVQGSTIKEQLEAMGITAGKKGAIDIDTSMGQTYEEFRDQLQTVLGLSDDMADMYATELVGHSAGARFDFATAGALSGWDILENNELTTNQDKQNYALLHGEQAQNALRQRDSMWDTLHQKGWSADKINQQFMNGEGWQQNKAANETMEEYENRLYEAFKATGALTDAEAKRMAYIQAHREDLREMAKLQEDYNNAQEKSNKNLKEGQKYTEGMTEAEKDSIRTKAKIGETKSDDFTIDEHGGYHQNMQDVYDADTLVEGATESEEAFQKAKSAAEELGGAIGTTMSDGSILTAEADESLEQYQQRMKDYEKDLKAQEQQEFGKNLFAGILEALQGLDEVEVGNLSSVLEPLSSLMEALSSSKEIDTSKIQEIIDLLNSFPNITIPEGVGEALTTLMDAINAGEIDEGKTQQIQQAFSQLSNAFSSLLSGKYDTTEVASQITEGITTLQEALADGEIEGSDKILEAVQSILKAFNIKIDTGNITSAAEQIQQGLNALKQALAGGEIEGSDKLLESMQSIAQAMGIQIPDTTGNLSTDITNIISQIEAALAGGNIEGADQILEQMNQILSAFGIQIPSGQGANIGAAIQTEAEAVSSGVDSAATTIKEAAKNLKEAWQELFDSMKEAGEQFDPGDNAYATDPSQLVPTKGNIPEQEPGSEGRFSSRQKNITEGHKPLYVRGEALGTGPVMDYEGPQNFEDQDISRSVTYEADTSQLENAQTEVEQLQNAGDELILLNPEVEDSGLTQIVTEAQQVSTALQEISANGTLNVNISIQSSMSQEEIHHLRDDFEDMSSKYNNIDVQIQIPEDGLAKAKELKEDFNQIKEALSAISGFEFPDLSTVAELFKALQKGNGEEETPGTGGEQPENEEHREDSSAHWSAQKDAEQIERSSADVVHTDSRGNQTAIETDKGEDSKTLAGIESAIKAMADAQCCDEVVAAIEKVGASVDKIADQADKDRDKSEDKGDKAGDKGKDRERGSGKEEKDGKTQIKGAKAEVTEAVMSAKAKPMEVPKAKAESVEAGKNIQPITGIKAEVDPKVTKGAEKDLEDQMPEDTEAPVEVTDNGTADEVQAKIMALPGRHDIPAEATDNGTIARIQAAINALQGKTLQVDVNVSVSGGSSGGFTFGGRAAGGITDGVANVAYTEIQHHQPTLDAIQQIVEHYQYSETGGGYGGTNKVGHSSGSFEFAGWHWAGATGGKVQSFVNGSANRSMHPGISLTAEEGPEIVWNKQQGYAYITGGGGHAEFTYLQPGDRVFNANETRQILNYRRPEQFARQEVVDPSEMELSDGLFGSHAAGSAYGSYGPQSSYGGGHGGRGGGGGKKRHNAKRKDYTPERYHLITRQVQDLTFWYQELEKAREAAYGVNVLDAIDREIEATKHLISANREYMDEILDYKEKDLQHLKDVLAGTGISLQLDEKGNVLNFEEIQERWGEEAAGAGPAIEALQQSEDEDAQDRIQEIIDEAKLRMNAVAQYEETLDKYQEIYEEFTDLLYQEAELRIEKITAKVEMEVKFQDQDIDILQHFLDKLDDNAWAIGDALDIVAKQMDLTAQKIDTIRQGVEDTFKEMRGENANQVLIKSNLNDENAYTTDDKGRRVIKTDWEKEIRDYIESRRIDIETKSRVSAVEAEEMARQEFIEKNGLRTLTADEYIDKILSGENFHIHSGFGEALEEQLSDLLSAIEDLDEYRIYAADRLSENYEKLAEDVGYQVDLFDHFASVLDTLNSITELQGIRMPQMIKDTTKQINQMLIQNNKNVIEAQKAQLAELTNTAAQLRNLIETSSDVRVKEIYKEQLRDVEDNINTAQEALLESLSDGLQTARDMFDATMEEITASYERAISAMYGTTDNLSDAIDRKRDIADQYVDDYEKFYQLTRLERTINKDIDDRTNKGIKNNQRLEAILQEINAIRATGQKMSENDLDLLQKRYDIAKAESDLEDARNAKSIVRLQRDRNGNWGYVYTAADDNNISDLEQARDDSIYEYQKALTESMNDLASKMADLSQQYQERNADLHQQFIDGTITEEELNNSLASLDEWFASQSAYIESQFTRFQSMASDTIDRAKILYSTSTFDILDKFGETVEAQVYGVNQIVQMTQNAYDATLGFRAAVKIAIDDYEEEVRKLDRTLNESMKNLNDYQTWANTVGQAIVNESDETNESVNNLSQELKDWVDNASSLVSRFQENYDRDMDPVIKTTEKFIDRLATALGYMNGINTSLETFEEARDATNLDISQPVATNSIVNNAAMQMQNQEFLRDQAALAKAIQEQNADMQQRITDAKAAEQQAQIDRWLHLIDLQAASQMKTGATLLNPMMFDQYSNAAWMNTSPGVAQTISITANFPNATNHSEIELAFNNLSNMATQYANRNDNEPLFSAQVI